VKFLIDEDVAIEVARCLQNAGHNVSLVTEILGGSADDFDIWRHAISTGKILITCNRQDFLECLLFGISQFCTRAIVCNLRRFGPYAPQIIGKNCTCDPHNRKALQKESLCYFITKEIVNQT